VQIARGAQERKRKASGREKMKEKKKNGKRLEKIIKIKERLLLFQAYLASTNIS